MKVTPFLVLATLTFSNVSAEEGTMSAIGHSASYMGTIIKDNAGQAGNVLREIGDRLETVAKTTANAVGGFLGDVMDGGAKEKAMLFGDAVSLNASVYSLSLRQAARDNKELKKVTKDTEEASKNIAKAQKESERLQSIAEAYKKDAKNFQANISQTLVDIAENAKKLEGWDKEKQEKLDKILKEHKKLGELTAEDGKSRSGEHLTLSMKESWEDLVGFIKKSPDSAAKSGLKARFNTMSSFFEGANKRLKEREGDLADTMAKLAKYNKFDFAKAADDAEALQRQMVFGTLTNSVNNLIINSEFQRNRSELAFGHFKDIEKVMAGKELKAGDVKEAYKKNIAAITEQYNETPIGLYVNNQIAKAMSTVCDLVTNQCRDGSNAEIFKFLDDSKRIDFKLSPKPEGNGKDKANADVR